MHVLESGLYHKGACTCDVRTRRGEGGTSKADALRKLSMGGCVKMQTRVEGGGQKIRKCRRHMYMPPNPDATKYKCKVNYRCVRMP